MELQSQQDLVKSPEESLNELMMICWELFPQSLDGTDFTHGVQKKVGQIQEKSCYFKDATTEDDNSLDFILIG